LAALSATNHDAWAEPARTAPPEHIARETIPRHLQAVARTRTKPAKSKLAKSAPALPPRVASLPRRSLNPPLLLPPKDVPQPQGGRAGGAVALLPKPASSSNERCQPYISGVDFDGAKNHVSGLACQDSSGHWWLMTQKSE
jgi:hypothetical protein